MFNFIITEVCNWNCNYCVFPELQSSAKHTTKDKISKHLPYINDIIKRVSPDVVTVQGGELGFIPEDVLEFFFGNLDYHIDVSTNGEFLKKGYHNNPIINSKIRTIMLHVADDIDNYVVESSYKSDIPLVYGIVDINKNPHNIRQFVKLNSHIYFEYIDFEHSISVEILNNNENLYSDLFDMIKDLDNVSDSVKNRILKKYESNIDKDIKVNQNMCMRLHPCVYIDLINERIPLCIRNYSKAFKTLSEQNLIKAITDITTFKFDETNCNCCFRMCQDEGIDINQIKKKIKLKGVLKK